MMFVSGETQEPTAETTTLVEQVVKEQVKELVGILPDSTFAYV
jgi:transcription initiation protein SPT3